MMLTSMKYLTMFVIALSPFALAVNSCTGDGDDEDKDGWTIEDGDCDDTNATVYPGAAEVCDELDNDCDGMVDEVYPCDEDEDGWTTEEGDCDDTNATVHPGAAEVCDELDNDCDGKVDEYDVCEEDMDEDGWAPVDGDCDDTNATVHPYAAEVCDELDNDCDGKVDEVYPCDEDEDGWTIEEGDCDDTNAAIHPGAAEVCDEIDNDCDELVDEYGICDGDDEDEDGWTIEDGDCDDRNATIHPGAAEVCDEIDNDCDAVADEDNACTAAYLGWSGGCYSTQVSASGYVTIEKIPGADGVSSIVMTGEFTVYSGTYGYVRHELPPGFLPRSEQADAYTCEEQYLEGYGDTSSIGNYGGWGVHIRDDGYYENGSIYFVETLNGTYTLTCRWETIEDNPSDNWSSCDEIELL